MSLLLSALLTMLAVASWPSGDRPARNGSIGRGRRDGSQEPTKGQGRRGARVASDADQEGEIAELVALALEAGLPMSGAVALAAAVTGHPEGDHRRADAWARAPGLAKTGISRESATALPRLPGLLETALVLSAEAGAPVAHSARIAATLIRERARSASRHRALMAGPRASMYLLTALPIIGPALALLLGLPVDLVFGNGLAVASVGAGLILTALGWLASRELLARAGRPDLVQRVTPPKAQRAAGRPAAAGSTAPPAPTEG